MKTSVIEMRDMLAVLTVDEVEKRLGEVPGVDSATVNYAAGNATVRYDETLLEVSDIKVLVHQRGKASAGDGKHEKSVPGVPPFTVAPEPTPSVESVSAPVAAASAGSGTSDQAPPVAPSSTPVATEPKSPTDASAASSASARSTPAADEHQDHEEPGAIEKFGTWVKDAFAGDDKSKAEPDAQTSTPVADMPKAVPGAPAMSAITSKSPKAW